MKQKISSDQIENLTEDILRISSGNFLKKSGATVLGDLTIEGSLVASKIDFDFLFGEKPLTLEGNKNGRWPSSYPFLETTAGKFYLNPSQGGVPPRGTLVWEYSGEKPLRVGENYATFVKEGLFTSGQIKTAKGNIISGLFSYLEGAERIIDKIDPTEHMAANYKIFANTEQILDNPSHFIEYGVSFAQNFSPSETLFSGNVGRKGVHYTNFLFYSDLHSERDYQLQIAITGAETSSVFVSDGDGRGIYKKEETQERWSGVTATEFTIARDVNDDWIFANIPQLSIYYFSNVDKDKTVPWDVTGWIAMPGKGPVPQITNQYSETGSVFAKFDLTNRKKIGEISSIINEPQQIGFRAKAQIGAEFEVDWPATTTVDILYGETVLASYNTGIFENFRTVGGDRYEEVEIVDINNGSGSIFLGGGGTFTKSIPIDAPQKLKPYRFKIFINGIFGAAPSSYEAQLKYGTQTLGQISLSPPYTDPRFVDFEVLDSTAHPSPPRLSISAQGNPYGQTTIPYSGANLYSTGIVLAQERMVEVFARATGKAVEICAKNNCFENWRLSAMVEKIPSAEIYLSSSSSRSSQSSSSRSSSSSSISSASSSSLSSLSSSSRSSSSLSSSSHSSESSSASSISSISSRSSSSSSQSSSQSSQSSSSSSQSSKSSISSSSRSSFSSSSSSGSSHSSRSSSSHSSHSSIARYLSVSLSTVCEDFDGYEEADWCEEYYDADGDYINTYSKIIHGVKSHVFEYNNGENLFKIAFDEDADSWTLYIYENDTWIGLGRWLDSLGDPSVLPEGRCADRLPFGTDWPKINGGTIISKVGFSSSSSRSSESSSSRSSFALDDGDTVVLQRQPFIYELCGNCGGSGFDADGDGCFLCPGTGELQCDNGYASYKLGWTRVRKVIDEGSSPSRKDWIGIDGEYRTNATDHLGPTLYRSRETIKHLQATFPSTSLKHYSYIRMSEEKWVLFVYGQSQMLDICSWPIYFSNGGRRLGPFGKPLLNSKFSGEYPSHFFGAIPAVALRWNPREQKIPCKIEIANSGINGIDGKYFFIGLSGTSWGGAPAYVNLPYGAPVWAGPFDFADQYDNLNWKAHYKISMVLEEGDGLVSPVWGLFKGPAWISGLPDPKWNGQPCLDPEGGHPEIPECWSGLRVRRMDGKMVVYPKIIWETIGENGDLFCPSENAVVKEGNGDCEISGETLSYEHISIQVSQRKILALDHISDGERCEFSSSSSSRSSVSSASSSVSSESSSQSSESSSASSRSSSSQSSSSESSMSSESSQNLGDSYLQVFKSGIREIDGRYFPDEDYRIWTNRSGYILEHSPEINGWALGRKDYFEWNEIYGKWNYQRHELPVGPVENDKYLRIISIQTYITQTIVPDEQGPIFTWIPMKREETGIILWGQTRLLKIGVENLYPGANPPVGKFRHHYLPPMGGMYVPTKWNWTPLAGGATLEGYSPVEVGQNIYVDDDNGNIDFEEFEKLSGGIKAWVGSAGMKTININSSNDWYPNLNYHIFSGWGEFWPMTTESRIRPFGFSLNINSKKYLINSCQSTNYNALTEYALGTDILLNEKIGDWDDAPSIWDNSAGSLYMYMPRVRHNLELSGVEIEAGGTRAQARNLASIKAVDWAGRNGIEGFMQLKGGEGEDKDDCVRGMIRSGTLPLNLELLYFGNGGRWERADS